MRVDTSKMTIKEINKLKLLTYVRVKFDDGALDGILIENQKDSGWIKVLFPSDETIQNINRDQMYKAGKVVDINFNESGLWD